MPCLTTNRNFCCLGGCQANRCCQPNRCCRPNCCCCPPRPPVCDLYGAGMLFDDPNGFTRTILPGNFDTMVPLNVFDPLLGMSESGGSLVVEKGGLYELRFHIGVQLVPSAPYEIFVMQTIGGVTAPIASTVESVPAGTILLPRLFSRTAEACLQAGTRLSLYVRVGRTGVLRIIPGALLSARRIGDC